VYGEACTVKTKDFRLTISQAGDEDRFSYHVSFYYGPNGGHMSDLGEYESPELAFRQAMIFTKLRPTAHLVHPHLTKRNLEVFRMFAVEGLSYAQIGKRIGIVKPRVAYHIYQVRDALEAETVHQAVFLATAFGLIP
jgi:DNA-binding CsgD family transcriptional regulator